MPTMQVYSSNSGSTVNYDRSGERYDKRVFIPRKQRDILLEVYLKMTEDGPRDSEILTLIARINHFDALARVCERLVLFNIKHEISCVFEDIMMKGRNGAVDFDKQALRMIVEIELEQEFPSMGQFLESL